MFNALPANLSAARAGCPVRTATKFRADTAMLAYFNALGWWIDGNLRDDSPHAWKTLVRPGHWYGDISFRSLQELRQQWEAQASIVVDRAIDVCRISDHYQRASPAERDEIEAWIRSLASGGELDEGWGFEHYALGSTLLQHTSRLPGRWPEIAWAAVQTDFNRKEDFAAHLAASIEDRARARARRRAGRHWKNPLAWCEAWVVARFG